MKIYFKNLTFLSFVLMLVLFSCQTDQVEEPIASTRNSASEGVFEWRHINNDTYKVLIQSMSENWSPEYISKIYPNLGDIIFRNALIALQGQDAHPELISVPIRTEGNVTGIIFCRYEATTDRYRMNIVDRDVFESSTTDELFAHFEPKNVLFALSTFVLHEAALFQRKSDLYTLYEELRTEISIPREICYREQCWWELVSVFEGGNSEYISDVEICITEAFYCSGGSAYLDNLFGYDSDFSNDGGGGDTSAPSDNGINYEPDDLCAEQLNAQVLDYINNELYVEFPCDDRSNNNIIKEIMDELCERNPMISIEDVNDALESIDKIVLPKKFKAKCPCFNYIFNTLSAGDVDNWLCDQIQDLADSDNYTVNIAIYDNGNDTARIYASSHNQTSTIYIPKDLCATGLMGSQEEVLKASGKFIHEFLHAFYHQEYLDEYLGFDLSNIDEWRAAWNDLVRKKYNIPDGEEIESNHHYLFFTELKETLMDALWRINGQKGSPSDYEYYVNIMISVENLATNDEWGIDLGLGIINGEGIYEPTFDNSIFKTNWDENVETFNLSCS